MAATTLPDSSQRPHKVLTTPSAWLRPVRCCRWSLPLGVFVHAPAMSLSTVRFAAIHPLTRTLRGPRMYIIHPLLRSRPAVLQLVMEVRIAHLFCVPSLLFCLAIFVFNWRPCLIGGLN